MSQNNPINNVTLRPCSCGGKAKIEQGFDVDCESTTATIFCEKCDIEFGPEYPNNINDVVEFMESWNKQMELKMKKILNRVTVTGADDSTDQETMMLIQQEFKFVEWGILVSSSSAGSYRFPSVDWIRKLVAKQSTNQDRKFQLAAHVCGKWIRDICQGNWSIFFKKLDGDYPFPIQYFDRIQLNFHGEKRTVTNNWLQGAKDWNELRARLNLPPVEFIFQLDGTNNKLLTEAINEGITCSGLIDLSHGAGVLPDSWPQPPEGTYTGYAGGLSVDNLEDQLNRISEVCGNNPIWIDAETRLRSDDDSIFDLGKVKQFLEIASNWVL